MILQNIDNTLTDNNQRFVIKNIEHAALATKLAENFGNQDFEAPEPRAVLLDLITHHDHGWLEIDDAPPINEIDGLPFNLVHTPFEHILKTSKGSPDFNEKRSDFAGLLSSMHTCGLYNGRYGLSDAINLDWIPDAYSDDVEAMLAFEMERQERLKEKLKNSELGDDKVIFRAYKFLQFVDACALYFNMNPAGQRGKTKFLNVPVSLQEDCDIELIEGADGLYQFKPYPFKLERFSLDFEGRYLKAGESSLEAPAYSALDKVEHQTIEIALN